MTPIDKYNTYNCCGHNMFLGNSCLKLKINKDKLFLNDKIQMNARRILDSSIFKNNNKYSFPI